MRRHCRFEGTGIYRRVLLEISMSLPQRPFASSSTEPAADLPVEVDPLGKESECTRAKP